MTAWRLVSWILTIPAALTCAASFLGSGLAYPWSDSPELARQVDDDSRLVLSLAAGCGLVLALLACLTSLVGRPRPAAIRVYPSTIIVSTLAAVSAARLIHLLSL